MEGPMQANVSERAVRVCGWSCISCFLIVSTLVAIIIHAFPNRVEGAGLVFAESRLNARVPHSLASKAAKPHDHKLTTRIAAEIASIWIPYLLVSRRRVIRFIIFHVVKSTRMKVRTATILVAVVVWGCFVWGIVIMRFLMSRWLI